MSHHSGYDTSTPSYPTEGRPRERRRTKTVHVGQTPMEYSASRLPAVFQSRIAVILAAVAVILLIFVLVFFVFLGGGKPKESANTNTNPTPVTGVDDKTKDEESSSSSVAEQEPTSLMIVYKVASGQECDIAIYDDGKFNSTKSQTVTGPQEITDKTTTKWTIATWTPEALTVTVNGEKVELKVDQEYNGMYAYTADFQQYLEQWRKDHGTAASNRQSAVENAANAASQASSSSSSAAAATQENQANQTDQATVQQGGEQYYEEAYDGESYYYGDGNEAVYGYQSEDGSGYVYGYQNGDGSEYVYEYQNGDGTGAY